MNTCQYCHKEIVWGRTAAGKRAPFNPDGTMHHRTCKAFHRMKARQARELREAYGPAKPPAEAFPENPPQLHFSF